jgi:hypothetical protein
MMIEVDWRTPFIDSIKDQKLPPALMEKALRLQASSGEAKQRVLFWSATSCTSMVQQQASL